MTQASQPPTSDAAMRRVLEELLRTDPSRSPLRRPLPTEFNVESLQLATGLARGTVHNALKHLSPVLESRSHRQKGRAQRGGKPTILYQLSRQAGEVLVLDFDHDRVTAWTADAFGGLLGLGDERIDVDKDVHSALEIGASLLKKRPASDWENMVGIGLSIPAPVDPDTQRTLGHVLPQWEGTDLDEALREHLGRQMAPRRLSIIADNDANLAGLAEHRSREARLNPTESLSSLVLVKTVPGNIGIGGGAVIDGRPIRGRGLAMELGHLSVDTQPPDGTNVVRCPHCKRTTCLQARISTDALVGGNPAPAWDDVVRWTRESLHAIRGARASAVEAGDTAEIDRLDARFRALGTDRNTRAIILAGEEMGRALAKVVTLLDPDVIALEGALAQAWLYQGVGSLETIVGDPLRETFEACSPLSRERPVTPTLVSAAGNCARGAAAAVLDKHLVNFILERIRL